MASTNNVGIDWEGKENSKGGQDRTQTGWAAFHFYQYSADPYHVVQDFVAKGELFLDSILSIIYIICFIYQA